MANTTSSALTSDSTDGELLSLYLSSPPAHREKTFITTAQAAEMTGVSMRTIQLWIESGAVRAIVIGRKTPGPASRVIRVSKDVHCSNSYPCSHQ